jgi:hypothetical protein
LPPTHFPPVPPLPENVQDESSTHFVTHLPASHAIRFGSQTQLLK